MMTNARVGQHVCIACGYNMIGPRRVRCPFCGAGTEDFLTDVDCSARYKLSTGALAPGLLRLNSEPPLGIEHSSYRIEARGAAVW
ncbi:MAG: MBL fold metallo-hydrolase, partial [Alphaproteobacteria bacterium]|nr:MBL fold metallo-hydrolase [Alphaproteobacteria bacterium]